MAPIGVIIFMSIILGLPFIIIGILSLKTLLSDKRELFKTKMISFLFISLGIGLILGFSVWGIKKSECLGGSSIYGKKSMTYSNGKVSYYKPRTMTAAYCEDHEGLNFGYIFKGFFLYTFISFGILTVGDATIVLFKDKIKKTKKQ